MYCSKCGKQIDYNATVCNECKSAEMGGYYYYGAAPAAAPVPPAAPVASTRMVGFGKALAGVIVGFFGYIFSIVAMVSYTFPMTFGSFAGATVFALMALVMGVLALVFGVQSIKTFKSLKNGPGGSPIATLILGIVSTAWGGFTLFFVVIDLVVAAALVFARK